MSQIRLKKNRDVIFHDMTIFFEASTPLRKTKHHLLLLFLPSTIDISFFGPSQSISVISIQPEFLDYSLKMWPFLYCLVTHSVRIFVCFAKMSCVRTFVTTFVIFSRMLVCTFNATGLKFESWSSLSPDVGTFKTGSSNLRKEHTPFLVHTW